MIIRHAPSVVCLIPEQQECSRIVNTKNRLSHHFYKMSKRKKVRLHPRRRTLTFLFIFPSLPDPFLVGTPALNFQRTELHKTAAFGADTVCKLLTPAAEVKPALIFLIRHSHILGDFFYVLRYVFGVFIVVQIGYKTPFTGLSHITLKGSAK